MGRSYDIQYNFSEIYSMSSPRNSYDLFHGYDIQYNLFSL